MSDTGQNRFEIDLDEIERQLRRSADLTPASSPPPSDPLAELARIVGQDDPFLNILGDTKRTDGARERQEPTFGAEAEPAPKPIPQSQADAVLTTEDRSVLGAAPLRREVEDAPDGKDTLDPVQRSFGRDAVALDDGDFMPMPPPRSRRRVGAVMALLALTAVGVAGAYTWRKMGTEFVASGPPPLIKADNAPLKVAPENPGGMDIPDQNKQIYGQSTDTGRSRVLDRQEQPIDVREAARQMPAPEMPATPPGPVQPPQQSVASAPTAVPAVPSAPAVTAPLPAGNGTVAAPAPRNAALNALGEPRRVRTVAVRPDGSAIGAPGGLMVSDPNAALFPSSQVPPPVSVATIAIPANGAASPTAPAAAPPVSAPATPSADGTTPTTATPVRVLPPSRPRSGAAAAEPEQNVAAAPEQGSRSLFGQSDAIPTDGSETPAAVPAEATARTVSVRPPSRPSNLGQRVAATDAVADLPEQQTGATSATGRTYAVQLAVRPSEDAARTAYDQLADKYATELGGKPATVTQAQVSGRSVYRVRVTPLSRDDANTLCTRLKASGGQCFVVAN
jgi:hypothetical protein